MLRGLSITNIAVVEKVEIEFGEGLNVLSGETGAGKSIIVDAIKFVLGGRTSKEIIRSGEEKARVEAIFDISAEIADKLMEFGIECGDELLIMREMTSEGKGSVRINGSMSTVSLLKEIGILLINIHGQHENQTLTAAEKHIDILDEYAGNRGLLAEYREHYTRALALNKEFEAVQIDEEEQERRIGLLTYEIEIIENAQLREGEYEELMEKRKFFQNSQRIIDCINCVYDNMAGESFDSLRQAVKKAEEALLYDGRLESLKEEIDQLYYSMEDIIEKVRDYKDGIDPDMSDLDMVEERIDEINELKRRFGADYHAIMSYLEKARVELNDTQTVGERLESLKNELASEKKLLSELGNKLRNARKNGAKKLEKAVMDELKDLDMKNTRFAVSFSDRDKFGANGVDRVEFLMSANVGMELGKLSKIASGGELSRFMLAINCALLSKEGAATMIYDEIDTGISGRAAQRVAEKLFYVAKGRQVLCVTHLAQIAAMADNHYFIEKMVKGGKTATQVGLLDSKQQVEELARIVGGMTVTEHTLKSAQDMRNQCLEYKKGLI